MTPSSLAFYDTGKLTVVVAFAITVAVTIGNRRGGKRQLQADVGRDYRASPGNRKALTAC